MPNDFDLKKETSDFYNFKTIYDITTFENGQKLDFIGLIHVIGNTNQVVLKNG